MDNITTLDALYKRDSKGKLRIWEIQWGYSDDWETIPALLKTL